MSNWKTQLLIVSVALALGACSSSGGKGSDPKPSMPEDEAPSAEPEPEGSESEPTEEPVEVPEGKVALHAWVDEMITNGEDSTPDSVADKPAILFYDNTNTESFAHLFGK
jgi:hypothetical protein